MFQNKAYTVYNFVFFFVLSDNFQMEFLSRNVSAEDNYEKKEKNLFQKA